MSEATTAMIPCRADVRGWWNLEPGRPAECVGAPVFGDGEEYVGHVVMLLRDDLLFSLATLREVPLDDANEWAFNYLDAEAGFALDLDHCSVPQIQSRLAELGRRRLATGGPMTEEHERCFEEFQRRAGGILRRCLHLCGTCRNRRIAQLKECELGPVEPFELALLLDHDEDNTVV